MPALKPYRVKADTLYVEHINKTQRAVARYLIISGVDISKAASGISPDRPFPDYMAIRDALHPDIIDVRTISSVTNPLVRLVRRRLGPQWAVAVAALLRANRYEAVIATGEDVGLPLAVLAKLSLRRFPLIMTCHNITTRRPAFYLGRLHAGAVVRTFQCLSLAQSRILIDRYDIDPSHIQVIRWFVDTHFFAPQPDAPIRDQICSAGMASRDYATLVAAARDLPVDVKIAADSPWFRQAVNIADDDIPARVEVRSYGTYASLRQLYAESLFVVIPLLDVDFSAGYTVILEAMAMGKAVIVSRIKQQDDFVVDGWNGYYVEPGNVGQLRERIRRLLDHPEEAKRMGANGRAMVEERFTLDKYVEVMGESLQNIVATPSTSRASNRYPD